MSFIIMSVLCINSKIIIKLKFVCRITVQREYEKNIRCIIFAIRYIIKRRAQASELRQQNTESSKLKMENTIVKNKVYDSLCRESIFGQNNKKTITKFIVIIL